MSQNPFLLKKKDVNPFRIQSASAQPQEGLGYVDQNIDSGDLGMSEDDVASKAVERDELGVMGAFKGAFENLGMVLSMPYGVASGVAGAIGDTATEVGTIAAGLNPFSDVKLSDSTMFDQSLKESAQGVRGQFGEDMQQGMYIPQSEEAQRVAEAVGDAIPREALQIAEALPPAGIAVTTGSRALGNVVEEGIERATHAVRSRGERMDANRQTLAGTTTGSKFMPDEHIEMVENAPAQQKALYSQIRDDSKSANNGAGNTDRSSWSVVGDQFGNRAEVLGEVGESYSRDMDKAMADIAKMTDQGGVRTLTKDLQTEMTDFLLRNKVTMDEKGKLDFENSPVFQGQGKLQKAVRRFMSGTQTESSIGAGTQNYASFEDLHTLKQALQQAGYGSKRSLGAGDRSTQIIQNLSGMVNGTLREISPKYADANDGLSSVIRSFEDLAGATKTDVSLGEADFTTGEWRKVAQNSRRMISNTDSGINMDQTLKNIDEVLLNESGKGANGNISEAQLRRLGFTPNSDGGFDQQVNLRQLALFSNYMDILNGDGKATAFKNLVAEANDRHFENLAANSIWGNQVGASASAVKAAQSWWRNEASQMKEAGKVVEKTDKLRASIKSEVDEAIKEMLSRQYE